MDLVCEVCSKGFYKLNKEYKRQIKKNPDVKFFCSRSCSATYGNIKFPRGLDNLTRKGRSEDEFSNFRTFVRKSKSRKKDFDIDCEYLKKLWDAQKGYCALSGIEMFLPKMKSKNVETPWKASLDRIDSSKGYVKGNVRFVCVIANYAKHIWTDKEFIEFIQKSAEFWKMEVGEFNE